jgi:regulator of protease activity HflC (stomatin/prohibitin superfamily)
MLSFPLIAIGIFAVFLFAGIRILQEYERGVVFRLGRYAGVKEAGFRWIIPGIDRMAKISLREIVMDVPTQEVITRDNVSVKVNAVLYFRVMDPEKAIIEVEDFLYATSQLAQTTLRSVLGEVELDDLLSAREQINEKLQTILDEQSDAWGIKVSLVEIKHVDLPQEMQRAIAKQAEAERERRAKVINAEGEFQAASRLAEAAAIIMKEPAALQLRYLQTLIDITGERTSLVLPIPLDLIHKLTAGADAGQAEA